jgi:hypothetical protein
MDALRDAILVLDDREDVWAVDTKAVAKRENGKKKKTDVLASGGASLVKGASGLPNMLKLPPYTFFPSKTVYQSS